METISGLPRPDFFPRLTDLTYNANRMATQNTDFIAGIPIYSPAAVYAYDAAGNIVSDGLHTDYFHNQNNRLIRVEIDGLPIAEYAYDAFERRTKKFADGVTTHYHYDLNGLLISETDGNGNPRKDYVYLNGEPVAMKVYGGLAGWYWFINDHLGTPQKMVDASGSVVWAAAYAPFGEARVYKDEVVNNLRFPGQYYDVETGLHYNWHRYYDPGTGRYLTPDPIGIAGGMNLYAYVSNNPINFADPMGLSKLTIRYIYGNRLTIDNPTGKEVIQSLQNSDKNSITLFQISGHGNSSSQCISQGTGCSDFLDSDLNVWSYNRNLGNISSLLNLKLNIDGWVDFAGCNNASGDKNIAKNASILLNDKPVRGGLWFQFGYENHWLFGNSSGSFGLKKTYVNGVEQ